MMAGGPKLAGSTLTLTRDMKYGMIPMPGAVVNPEGTHSSVELALKDVLNASSPAANLVIEPNDVVSVPAAPRRLIYIIGEVNRPGAVELVAQESASVVQVLAAAGGVTKIAAPGKTAIMRTDSRGLYDKVASIDLKKIMSGQSEDRLLIAGDILVVPTSAYKGYFQALTMAAVGSSVFILQKF
jgi:polysaccharide export outer membrane protein